LAIFFFAWSGRDGKAEVQILSNNDYRNHRDISEQFWILEVVNDVNYLEYLYEILFCGGFGPPEESIQVNRRVNVGAAVQVLCDARHGDLMHWIVDAA